MKQTLFSLAAFLCALLAPGLASSQNLDENGALPRATPESVGLDSNVITETIRQLDEKFARVDAVMILRDGKVVSEAWRAPNGPDIPHALYSLSKSFCSTAVGFAIQEGKMSLDQKLVDIFPDDVPENPSENLKKIDIESLLSMSCGHEKEIELPNKGILGATYGLPHVETGDNPTWVHAFMGHPVPFEPKTHFLYNTAGTYMVSAALQKSVGETARDYLIPRLFEPLHIDVPFWEESPEGISKGGTGLYLKTEDIAKFGQFYLQKGMWNGKQLLNAEWIENATSKHISNGTDPNSDWAQGYCFQFWRCRYNVYRGDGAYCQFCVVMPDQNMVVAINSDCGNYQGILNVLFDNLIPAAKDAPLAENPDAIKTLRETEKSLAPKEPSGGARLELRSLQSKALGREVKYRVYVPNEYQTTSFSYPVLYLLHGMGGNEADWSSEKQGNMVNICNAYFAEHPDQKRIIVMPDARSDWYRDSADNSCKYETFFFDELMPEIERSFRCKTDKKDRAIAGLSMGGYGCMLYALRHPDKFESCYAMSAAIRTKDEVETHSFNEFLKRYKSRDDMTENDNRFDDYYFANDPHTLVKKLEDKKAVRFMLDCGDDDGLLAGNWAFFNEARAEKVPCELRVRNGGHVWQYWREALPMCLEFIAK